MDYKKAAYNILGILQELAPNSIAQEECSKTYKAIQNIATDDKELLLNMTGALYDGLAYGNWPWIKYPS